MLRDLCVINGFGFICSDMIATKYLCKDGIHLQDLKPFTKYLKYHTTGKVQFFIFGIILLVLTKFFREED